MMTDDGAQTQQQTQSTQQASQNDYVLDTHLWGYLIPCSANLRRIDFQKIKTSYRIGRNREEHKNDIILPGMKISNFHCIIEWDGDETPKSAIKVTDASSNGTFINGERIGKGKVKILRDGNEIAFGTSAPQPANGGLEDYRFVYRHMACGLPNRGLHKYYDLQHELGKGSFATVMKALHREEDKWYAVKMIQANKLRRNLSNVSVNGVPPEDKTSNFAREINILERLQHRNICQLKEVFFEPYSINLVLEWVPGGDLLEYILNKSGISEPEAQSLTYQICDALAYVHAQGIAHRDLKPENVLLTDDSPPIVKVADFGLAKVIDSMTMLRTMCGTPVYLAPEVVNQGPDNEGYDQLVDSWSVGVIVYSMLTMSTPFGDEDVNQDVKTRVANRQVQWDYLQECGASPLAEDFIRRLLEYDPRKRMSLTDARDHPWLADQRAAHAASAPPPSAPVSAPASQAIAAPRRQGLVDASMRSIISNSMSLDDDAVMDTGRMTPPYVPGLGNDEVAPDQILANAIERLPSRLVRRSNYIQRARDMGQDLPGPSQEMQQRAAAEEEAENLNDPPSSRVNKRKAALDFEASLTPMDEEGENDAGAGAEDDPAPAGARGGRTKRGRGGAKKVVAGAAPPSSKRGRGRAATATPAANGDESEGGGLRRSSRLNQGSPVPVKVTKVARRI
ncbi:Pkinase-domain-containing protein [Dichomitus squalens]|nr:Pkinase-domain-containing protein [Dichomitus squalens]